MLELYHNDMSSCAQKVRLVLAEKGLEWKGHHMNLRAGDTRTPEYKKMNPAGVVPTLIDDGTIICESTVIIEYLDDAYPDNPVRPSDPKERAKMRDWTKKLDEGLHADTGTISGTVAFRYQSMAGRSVEEFLEHMEKIPEPVRRARTLENNLMGIESPHFPAAIKRWDALFAKMENALKESDWIVGDSYSLADVAYTPYVVRMHHLNFKEIFDSRPNILDWYDRIQARPNFIGISDWLNEKYLPLMAEKGAEAWPRVKEILAS